MCRRYYERGIGWTNRETALVDAEGFFDDDTIEEALKDAILNNAYQDQIKQINLRYGMNTIANDPHLAGVPRALELWLADWMKQQMDDYLAQIWSNIDHMLRWDFSQGRFLKDLMGSDRINWLELAGHYQEQIENAVLEAVTNIRKEVQ